MFPAAGDPLPPHCLIEGPCIAQDLLDVLSVASTAQGVLIVIAKRNVEHGTKCKIEPEKPSQTCGDVAVAPDQIDIILLAKLLRIRRFVPDPPQSRDAPSFLINRNDRLDLA